MENFSNKFEDGFVVDTSFVEEEKPIREKLNPKKEIIEWLGVVASALIIVVILFGFVFRVAIISGDSMKNTLLNGDVVVITNLNYEPRQGDIVVISRNADNSPKNQREENGPIIKRIIATEFQNVRIDFEKGIPVALNDEKMSAKNIILKLNEIGGANGIGLLDIVENRLVGMKCRGVYETPGGSILYKAHSVLESICLDKMTLHEKQRLAITYAELVYNGQWFTPLREALAAFVDKTQEKVTGKVRLKLYKGNMINAGVWSDYSLYSEEIATFGESDYNQADSAGFINLFGLPIKVQAMVDGKK